MNNQLMYLISLLAVVMALSFIIGAAPEDNKTIVNDIILNNTTLTNSSLNFSAMNDPAINATDHDKADTANNIPFIIGKVKARQMGNVRVNALVNDAKNQPPKKDTFVIDGYSRPTINWTDQDQSLLNAAYISCKVGQTPHGYATYYN